MNHHERSEAVARMQPVRARYAARLVKSVAPPVAKIVFKSISNQINFI